MAETKLVVEHREQLWSLLVEAAQIEHLPRAGCSQWPTLGWRAREEPPAR